MTRIKTLMALSIVGCSSVFAGVVTNKYKEIKTLDDVTQMPVPDDMKDKIQGAENIEMLMIGENAQKQTLELVNGISDEYLWLQVNSDEATVLMYGEDSDKPDNFNIILYVDGDEQKLMIFLSGNKDMFDNFNLMN